MHKLKGRELKSKIYDILQNDDWYKSLIELITIQKSTVSSALFSFVYNPNPIIKWRAVSAFGILSDILSDNDIDKIRILVRRCIWMLTEESGGIPWGVPEVIGEILAKNKQMATEFNNMLMSYIYESDGPENYLEHTPLRQGVYWGILRLAQSFPKKVTEFQYVIEQRINRETEPVIIAYLINIIALAKLKNMYDYIDSLKNDFRQVDIFIDNDFLKTDLASIAKQLSIINKN